MTLGYKLIKSFNNFQKIRRMLISNLRKYQDIIFSKKNILGDNLREKF